MFLHFLLIIYVVSVLYVLIQSFRAYKQLSKRIPYDSVTIIDDDDIEAQELWTRYGQFIEDHPFIAVLLYALFWPVYLIFVWVMLVLLGDST